MAARKTRNYKDLTEMTNAPRRFYKTASVSGVGPFNVALDGRPIKTPAKVDLSLPTQALAEAIAEEWDRQGETLDLPSMTLTRLANVAIDRTPTTRDDLTEEVVRYCETDLLCHLAESPIDLRAEQDRVWSPLRGWAGKTFGIFLIPVEGILATRQPDSALSAARSHAHHLDDFRLTGLVHGCGLLGSAILALALEQGHITSEAAFSASRVDDDWQTAQWGKDPEAVQIAQQLARDVQALGDWFEALS